MRCALLSPGLPNPVCSRRLWRRRRGGCCRCACRQRTTPAAPWPVGVGVALRAAHDGPPSRLQTGHLHAQMISIPSPYHCCCSPEQAERAAASWAPLQRLEAALGSSWEARWAASEM